MTAERLTLTDEERAQLALDYPDSREDSNDFDRLVNVAFALGLSRGLQRAAEIAQSFADCSYYQSAVAVNLDHMAHSDAHDACHTAINIAAAIDREREGGDK